MDPKDKPPRGIVPNMNDAALAMHELYLSYQSAGFTKEEAFRMILAHIGTIRAPEGK